MATILKLIIVIAIIYCEKCLSTSSEDAYSLKIPASYYRTNRPNLEGEPVEVGFSMFITNLELKHRRMEVVMFFRQFWTDSRLKDETRKNVSFKAEEVLDKIWTPGLFHPNAVEPSQIINKGFVRITPAGEIVFTQLKKETLACPDAAISLPIARPAPQIQCKIDIESYGYPSSEVVVIPKKGADSLDVDDQINKGHEFYQYTGYNITENQAVLLLGNYGRVTVSLYFENQLGRLPEAALMHLWGSQLS